MNKNYKIFAAAFPIILSLSAALFVFSCSGDQKNETSGGKTDDPAFGEAGEPGGETSKYADDELGEFDFGGHEFKSLCRPPANITVEDEIGEVLNDAIYYRNRNIEERFNISFKETILTTDLGDVTAKWRTALLAGDKYYDVMMIRGPTAYMWAQEGLLQPMTNLPNVNLEKPYWDKWVMGEMSCANKIFFAVGAYDLQTYCGRTHAMLFNKKLAEDLDLGSLYELVNGGKWTIDRFCEMALQAKRDLNGDGIYGADDQHGFIGIVRNILPALWTSAGVKTIEKDSDDLPYLAALEPGFIDVWDKIADVCLARGAWFNKAPDPDILNDPELPVIFRDGRTLFYASSLGEIPDLREMETDFGILPYPKYDEAQERYISRLTWVESICVPAYCDDGDLELVSVILEALACESAKSVMPVYIEDMLKTKSSRDAESEAMIDLLLSNRVFDWGDGIWNELLRDIPLSQIFPKKADTLVSTLEKSQKKIQSTIDKTVEMFLALD